MLNREQIVGSARAIAPVMAMAAALFLGGCGQKGPLYLPTGEAAAARISLPQTLNPVPAMNPATPASAPTETGTGTANPAPRP
jgi:predicted small lipoprotein YifL